VFESGDALCYSVEVLDTDAPVTAGIYEGAAGIAGLLVIDFNLATNGPEACIPVDPTVADTVFANPSGYYAQVTTAEFPDGALRGQLEQFTLSSGELTFEPLQGPPGTVITVTSITPCSADEAHVALMGFGWGSIAWDFSDPDDVQVEFDASDFVVEDTVPTASDGSWTAQLAVPQGADKGKAFFFAVCADPTANAVIWYQSDLFRILPLQVAEAVTTAGPVAVEPTFTG
jgi:hypothetical protein